MTTSTSGGSSDASRPGLGISRASFMCTSLHQPRLRFSSYSANSFSLTSGTMDWFFSPAPLVAFISNPFHHRFGDRLAHIKKRGPRIGLQFGQPPRYIAHVEMIEPNILTQLAPVDRCGNRRIGFGA